MDDIDKINKLLKKYDVPVDKYTITSGTNVGDQVMHITPGQTVTFHDHIGNHTGHRNTAVGINALTTNINSQWNIGRWISDGTDGISAAVGAGGTGNSGEDLSNMVGAGGGGAGDNSGYGAAYAAALNTGINYRGPTSDIDIAATINEGDVYIVDQPAYHHGLSSFHVGEVAIFHDGYFRLMSSTRDAYNDMAQQPIVTQNAVSTAAVIHDQAAIHSRHYQRKLTKWQLFCKWCRSLFL